MNDIKTVVGVDIAKRVFQLHEVSPATGETVSVQVRRDKFLLHFANRSACLIGMEACGGAQHWARKLIALGHAVKLLPAQQVKAFVCGRVREAQGLRDCLKMLGATRAGMIQDWDVDPEIPRPGGAHRAAASALSDRSTKSGITSRRCCRRWRDAVVAGKWICARC